jgi:adenylate kinase family enzyme
VPGLPPRPWPAWLLVGPTGSGKTPLGQELERSGAGGRTALHFDFGAALREIAGGRAADLGLDAGEIEAVRTSLATGALFEDRDLPLIVKVLTGFAARRGLAAGTLIVLNGLPRHRGQALALAPVVAVERVISLEAGPAVIGERLRLDPGRDRAGRIDDDPAAVARRLETYGRRTAPLLDHYRERGVPVTRIAVTAAMTAAEMRREIERLASGEGGRP